MSQDLNQVQCIGRLGRDPESRYLANGDAVANFSIACSESWKDKNTGEKVEKTEWIRCVAFRQLAEIVSKYLVKGKQVYVSGRLTTRKWQDKEGRDNYTTEVVLDQMQMLGRGDGEGERAPAAAPAAPARRPVAPPLPAAGKSTAWEAGAPATASAGSGFDDMDDDIPF